MDNAGTNIVDLKADIHLKLVVGPHGDQDLADLDAGRGAVSLAEGSPHSGLEPISSGAGQHFVDPEHVEGVDPDADVEGVLAAVLDEILVAADAAGLQRLGGQLLELVGHQVDGEGELVHAGLLTSEVIDPDLGVGDTTVESALGIGLILAVAIALGRSPTHLYF